MTIITQGMISRYFFGLKSIHTPRHTFNTYAPPCLSDDTQGGISGISGISVVPWSR